MRKNEHRSPSPGIILLCCLLAGSEAHLKLPVQAAQEDKIAVASDLHVNIDAQYAGTMNPLTMYSIELVDALLWDIDRQETDVLLLCGDITNGGRTTQHETLIQVLDTGLESGMDIYVLPGNHDLTQDDTKEFETLYGNYGYLDAYGRDTDSLSYSILRDGVLILMLDTDGYSIGSSHPRFSELSLQWIRTQLEQAKRNKWLVLAAGHYPILSPYIESFEGRQELIDMLEEYEVPLYLCGHMHQRGVSMGNSLVELVVEQMPAYPCSYALLTINSSQYIYEPRRIDVGTWAKERGYTDPVLAEFDKTEQEALKTGSTDIIAALKRDRELSPEEESQAVEFFEKMMHGYQHGDLYDIRPELYEHPGYQIFTEIAEGTTYGKWIPIIMKNALPFTTGFTLMTPGDGGIVSILRR